MNESIDTLFDGAVRLLQAERGDRFSLDSLLLAASVRPTSADRVVDLGSGNGVISFALAHRSPPKQLLGLELQTQLIDRARRSAALNEFACPVTFEQGDVRRREGPVRPHSADLVVMNPPYFPANDGRLNPDDEKAAARHELNGTLGDFIAAAAYLLDHKGRLALVYPARRVEPLFAALAATRLRLAWLRFVHPRPETPATHVLAAARKGGGAPVEVLTPLTVRVGDQYSPQVLHVLSGGAL